VYYVILERFEVIRERLRTFPIYANVDWDKATDDQVVRAIETYKCLGLGAPILEAALHRRQERAAAIAASQAAADRCAADPACVAQQKRERLTALREVMCQDVGQRQDAQASIREEWKYAHQAGVVDLQNLSDNRTLLEMADELSDVLLLSRPLRTSSTVDP
jgi:hypothetical protein